MNEADVSHFHAVLKDDEDIKGSTVPEVESVDISQHWLEDVEERTCPLARRSEDVDVEVSKHDSLSYGVSVQGRIADSPPYKFSGCYGM